MVLLITLKVKHCKLCYMLLRLFVMCAYRRICV